MKIVVENIFMCFVLFWKCYFPTNFSHFLSYFLSIQTNFKITAKSQSTEQITAKSQHHTPPKLQWRPTAANSDNQNHQNTTTTPPQQQQKSKSQREIGGSKARSHGGEIDQRQDRRRDWAARCWISVWFMARSAFGSLSSFFLWLSLSFAHGRKWFEGKMNL